MSATAKSTASLPAPVRVDVHASDEASGPGSTAASPSRRRWLGGGLGLALAAAVAAPTRVGAAGTAGSTAAANPADAAAPSPLAPSGRLPRLALYGPPAGPSIVVARAIASGRFAALADDVSLAVWRSPDELRAGLTSGAIDLSIVPVQAAANLYNRGMGLRLVNVMTEGLLYIVAPAGTVAGLNDLAGKRIAVAFVNDTPDFVLKALLARASLTGKVELLPVGSPIEAAQLLLAGRIDGALLSEPVASVAVQRSAGSQRPLARVLDLQQAWGQSRNGEAVLPQAGLAVTERFLKRNAALIEPLQHALADAAIEVNAEPAAAAASAATALEQPAPVLAASIPFSRLTARPARQARPAIEAMLELMAASDPAIIGGHLPDDGFYLI